MYERLTMCEELTDTERADVCEWLRANVEHERMLRWFLFDHLPPKLQQASGHFGVLAMIIVVGIPPSAERTVALRKLLESKDAAVRAAL